MSEPIKTDAKELRDEIPERKSGSDNTSPTHGPGVAPATDPTNPYHQEAIGPTLPALSGQGDGDRQGDKEKLNGAT